MTIFLIYIYTFFYFKLIEFLIANTSFACFLMFAQSFKYIISCIVKSAICMPNQLGIYSKMFLDLTNLMSPHSPISGSKIKNFGKYFRYIAKFFKSGFSNTVYWFLAYKSTSILQSKIS